MNQVLLSLALLRTQLPSQAGLIRK